jgi:hypothetical protein
MVLAGVLVASAGCGKSEGSSTTCASGSCGGSTCTPGAKEACGKCGTRLCDQAGAWGVCTGEGSCTPGQSMACGDNGTMTCAAHSDGQCGWELCTAPCTAGQTSACGNCGTMTCDPGGKWGACTDGPCTLGTAEGCSPCSKRTCAPVYDSELGVQIACGWSECLSTCDAGKECRQGVCVACGAEGTSCCEGSLCDGELECSGANTCTTPGVQPDASVDLDAGEDGEAGLSDGGAPTCTFASRDDALIVYYGAMADSSGWRDDLNFKLYNPKLDVVFTGGGTTKWTQGAPDAPGQPGTGEFKAFHDHCLRVAWHIGTGQLIACMRQRDDLVQSKEPVTNPCNAVHVDGASGAADLAALFKSKLDLGWDYIAIDEIKDIDLNIAGSSNTLSTSMKNDTANVKVFASALAKLAADGYDRRVITFFVPHNNTPCTAPPNYSAYNDFFVACRDHCRTIMHEWYFNTTEIEQGAAKSFNCIAEALHATGVTNINRVTTAIIAVGSDESVDWAPFDDAPCDISPWPAGTNTCSALSGSGGLKRQLDAMHASTSASRYWWGVGFYKIGAVTTGSKSGTSYWNRTDFAESTAARVNWWATHPQP